MDKGKTKPPVSLPLGLQTMGCGACGYGSFRLYKTTGGALLAECAKCKSVSSIDVKASIGIDWVAKLDGVDSDGCLCIMELETKRRSPNA